MMTSKISSKARIGRNVQIGDFVIIHDNVEIGDDTVIESYCELGVLNSLCDSTPLVIGKNSHIRSHSVLYSSSKIGDDFVTGHRVTIREKTIWGSGGQAGTLCDIQGHCTIGNYVKMHSHVFVAHKSIIQDYAWLFPGVVLANDPHPPSESIQGCKISKFAAIGTKSVILPSVCIGEDSLIGAGSTVTRDIPSLKVAVGNPARIIGDVTQIKLQNDSQKYAYPWRRQFHRGYPEHIVKQWKEEFPDG